MKLQAETTVFNDDKVQSKFSELIVDADGIRTEVGTKVGNNEVISRINQSAESVKIEASKVAIEADNYITAFGSNGVEVHPKNDNSNYLTIDPTNGMKVYKGGVATAQYGDSAIIGKESAAHSVIDADGQRFYASNGTTQLANIGYGSGAAASGTATAPYYSFGTRASGSTIGNYSSAMGYSVSAEAYCSVAEGRYTEAQFPCSHACGTGTKTNFSNHFVIGEYNTGIPAVFTIGNGSDDSHRSDAFTVDSVGRIMTKQIQTGSEAATSVGANSYEDVQVSFTYSMAEAPIVVVGLRSDSTAGAIGSISVAVLTGSVTKNGFKARIFNAGGSTRVPAFNWIAINMMAMY